MEDQNVSEREHQRRLPCLTIMALSICFNIINHALIGFVAVYMSLICSSAELKPMTWHAWSCTIGVWSTHKKKTFFKLSGIIKKIEIISVSSADAGGNNGLLLGKCLVFTIGGKHQTLHPFDYSSNRITVSTEWNHSPICELQRQTLPNQTFHRWIDLGNIPTNFTVWRGCHLESFSFTKCSQTSVGEIFSLRCWNHCHRSRYSKKNGMHFVEHCKKSLPFISPSGLVALCYGYDKRFMRANSDEDIRYYLRLIAWCTAAFSLIGALQSLQRKINVILWTRWNFGN